MSRVAAYAFTLLTALPAVAAQPGRDLTQLEAIAVCSGRFAAMRGGGWAVPGLPMPPEAAAARFDDLYAAAGPLPSDRSPEAARLRRARAQAQGEQAQLVTVALFSADARRALRARLVLAERLRACASLLPE